MNRRNASNLWGGAVALSVVGLVASLALLPLLEGCNKTHGGVTDGGSAGDDAAIALPAPPPMSAEEADLWAHVSEDDADPEERLVQHVGCTGVMDRLGDPKLRPVAIRALAFCSDFSALPALAAVAARGTEAEAMSALAAASELAARPRRSVDPEDALELRAGCDALMALAKAHEAPKSRRLLVLPVLTMLSDRGCAKPGEIAEMDVR